MYSIPYQYNKLSKNIRMFCWHAVVHIIHMAELVNYDSMESMREIQKIREYFYVRTKQSCTLCSTGRLHQKISMKKTVHNAFVTPFKAFIGQQKVLELLKILQNIIAEFNKLFI